MKPILTLVLLMLNLVCISASTDTDPNTTLTIEGRFIAEKHVRYEVYSVMADSTVELLTKGKDLTYFAINVEIGEHYLIKFISKKNEVKYLYVDACENGDFRVDVDFNKEGSGLLTYSSRKKQYRVTEIDTKQLRYVKEGRTN